MRSWHIAALALALSCSTGSAQEVRRFPEAPAGSQACLPSAPVTTGAFDFFLQITPTDSPLDVWCRLQAMKGDYRMTVFFPLAKAHDTFEISFDGTPSRSKGMFAAYLQSLVPTTADGGDTKSEFAGLLSSVVQASAARAPDEEKSPIGMPPRYEKAERIALWQPMWINVRGLRLYDVDYDMSIRFRPDANRFVASIEGRLQNMVVKGWRSDVLSSQGASRTTCGPFVPLCKDLPEVVPLDMAWRLESIVLTAKGDRLSKGARDLLDFVERSAPAKEMLQSNMDKFSPALGSGEVTVRDGSRSIVAKAKGVKGGGGTSQIGVVYKENPRHKASFTKWLEAYAGKIRDDEAIRWSGVVEDSVAGEAGGQ